MLNYSPPERDRLPAEIRAAFVGALLGALRPARPWRLLAPQAGDLDRTARSFRLSVAPESGDAFPFEPGQFAFLSFPGRGVLAGQRPLCIVSAPGERRLIEFAVRDCGAWSGALKLLLSAEAAHGKARALVSGPFGGFRAPRGERRVFLAGGIGGAAFLSMLRAAAAEGSPGRTLLVWGAATREDLFCLGDLAQLARAHPNLAVVPVLSHDPRWTGERGRLDREKLERLVPAFFGGRADSFEWNSASYRLCGPGRFNRDLARTLKSLGVARGASRALKFSL